MSEIVRISTGVCFQWTPLPPRFDFKLISIRIARILMWPSISRLSSLRIVRLFLFLGQRCRRPYLKNFSGKSARWPVSTTSPQKLSLGRGGLAPMLCAKRESTHIFLLPYCICHSANHPLPRTPLASARTNSQRRRHSRLLSRPAGREPPVRVPVPRVRVCVLTARSLRRDFDDATSLEGQPSGLAATQVLAQTPAAVGLLAGTSSNPLDDLVSIFGSGGPLAPATPAVFGGGAFGGMGLASAPPTPAVSQTPKALQSQQEDLLGLF